MKYVMERLPAALFALTLVGTIWAYGALSASLELVPYPQIAALVRDARAGLARITGLAIESRPWWYQAVVGELSKTVIHNREAMAPGLTLIAGMGPNNDLMMKVVSADGAVIHEWEINWFEQWPEPLHLPKSARPKEKPGTHTHGVVFTEAGDVVFNFERNGMISLDVCGQVNWRLGERTHHSLYWDADRQSYWTTSLRPYGDGPSPYPNLAQGFQDNTIMEVEADGKVRREFSLVPLLIGQGLSGLLYLSTIDNWGTSVSGDILHVNDVETFPASLQPGVFAPGDIMVSIRNLNAILVLDGTTLAIKFISMGKMLRQHDPDFIDGNTISVFDNNNLWPHRRPQNETTKGSLSSRIITIDARNDSVQERYKGTETQPFFTSIMGKHEWLPNSNLLLVESLTGRILEVSPSGELVWELFNVVQPGIVGMISDAQRLPPRFDEQWFQLARARCAAEGD